MAKYSKTQKISTETQEEAMAIAKGTQRPGQTKEQTKLIAQGIQKGIDQYKKKQKSKAREVDKQRKKSAELKSQRVETGNQLKGSGQVVYRQHWLPWVLLVISWLGMAVYFFAGG